MVKEEIAVAEQSSIIEPKVDPRYFVTPYIQKLVDYSLAYLKADLPINYSGPAGIGKTSLAFYVACQLKHPIVVIHGDEGYITSDLVGAEHGYRKYFLKDQFIHSVTKKEEHFTPAWTDNRLTIACKNGFTLIYDEFTRSRPEANNILLSVLEEKMLDLPATGAEENYLRVHPNFRVIFTSNPTEYAGVFKAQDALRDRLVTITIDRFDEETEIGIVKSRTGVAEALAKKVVSIVRSFVSQSTIKTQSSTLRYSIKITKALTAGGKPANNDEFFRSVCLHVLTGQHASSDPEICKNINLLNKILGRFRS